MELYGIHEIVSVLYVAKLLYDAERFDLVREHFYEAITSDEDGIYDMYINNMCGAIQNIFDYYEADTDDNDCNIEQFSSVEVEEYFGLAKQFGERNHLSEDENPYIKNALNEVEDYSRHATCFTFEMCREIKPGIEFNNRIVLTAWPCDCIDLGYFAASLIRIYEWFHDEVIALRMLVNQEVAA